MCCNALWDKASGSLAPGLMDEMNLDRDESVGSSQFPSRKCTGKPEKQKETQWHSLRAAAENVFLQASRGLYSCLPH